MLKYSNTFNNLEKTGGILLFSAAILAILISNSPLYGLYHAVLTTPASIKIGVFELSKPLYVCINDGLMTIYFLLVGLEIKREILRGTLCDTTSIIVPAIAAFCGLILPAFIYYCFNYDNSTYIKGWAIPSATDIAFTLGVLALLGKRVPLSLKLLLASIAIFDDIAAIVIIAIFYTSTLSYASLILSLIFTLSLIVLNRFHCTRLSLYLVIGACLWFTVLKSGVHATLAGIIIAFTIPDKEKGNSPLTRLEKSLLPWCAFIVLPLFAFANSGLNFSYTGFATFTHPVVAGTALGLLIGKQIGIFIPLFYFVKYKHYLAYANITLTHIYGLALLCGVGFTMSLFIGSLAFKGPSANLLPMVKLGVVSGSLISGILGYLVLRRAIKPKPKKQLT